MGRTVKKHTKKFKQEATRLALKSVNVDEVARDHTSAGMTKKVAHPTGINSKHCNLLI